MCRGQHGGMKVSTTRRHVCSEKARTALCIDYGGAHVRCIGCAVAVPGGSGGFGIFSQMPLLSADWSEMSRMRLPTRHTCPFASSGRRCVQAQCTSGTLHTVSGSYVLFLDDETTIPGAL